jgi:hypothetical protein
MIGFSASDVAAFVERIQAELEKNFKTGFHPRPDCIKSLGQATRKVPEKYRFCAFQKQKNGVSRVFQSKSFK